MIPGGAGLVEYVKHAFLYRWNLLVFFGAVTASALSPWPDATLPLIMAAEVAYLGGLTSIQRFRDAIDAKVHQQAQEPRVQAAGQSLAGVVNSLAPELRRRFEMLRGRCLEMRSIARSVGGESGSPGEDLSTPALDRLLWVFLRLLASQQALDRFLRSTSEVEIRARVEDARKSLEGAPPDERFKRSLQDSIAAGKTAPLVTADRLKETGKAFAKAAAGGAFSGAVGACIARVPFIRHLFSHLKSAFNLHAAPVPAQTGVVSPPVLGYK